MTEDAFLRCIAETPDDAALRQVYADWLEDHVQPASSELVRVGERMRRVPVFSDEYWPLKARRNELRPARPVGWLAATGYNGSRRHVTRRPSREVGSAHPCRSAGR